ncbi:MAG TPA: helicase C-terminal domain-containing protein [Mycobacteriales bacterium]|nr:helicase C-terminal domain-containing protein [Mycobacteriales bacterium]
MSEPRAGGSALVEWLRGLSDDALAALLLERPDLAVPSPADTAVLATRAGVRVSALRALERLTRFELEVLDGLLIAGNGAPLAQVEEIVGAPVGAAIGRLRALALVHGTDDGLVAERVLHELVGARPAGLGRRFAAAVTAYATPTLHAIAAALGMTPLSDRNDCVDEISDALTDPDLVAGLPDDERVVLERLAATGPLGALGQEVSVVPFDQADTPVRRLLARGLLVAVDHATVELPREVGLVLRGEHPLGPVHPEPPDYEVTDLGTDAADSAGAGQASEVVRLVEVLLEWWGTDPPPVLRAGGLGVRDLRSAARLLESDERMAALVIETAYAAGLLDSSADEAAVFAPTPGYDTWLARDPGPRWALLADAWLRSGRLPGLVGERDDRDRALPPLGPELLRVGAAEARRDSLVAVDAAGPGIAPTAASVIARLSWLRPRRGGRARERTIGWALEEAALLGITGRGALTSAGRALLAGDLDAAASAVAKRLPEPGRTVLLQPDLTAVAPGPLVPEVARELAFAADVESSGPGRVYRFTEASVRRALDTGRAADELLEFLTAHSQTPVPQALSYLIGDVARRHGQMRVGVAASYLRAEDAALLAEVASHRKTQSLGLRRLAPTVYVSKEPVSRVLEVLRESGYAPVAESPEGLALVASASVRRVAAHARVTRTELGLSPEQAERIVRTVREGDKVALARPGADDRSAATTLARLQQAVREGTRVWIGYVDTNGRSIERIVEPASLDHGFLSAYDDATGETRNYAVHRITGVNPIR